MSGPFETEDQARELPAVQAVYRAFDASPEAGAHGAAHPPDARGGVHQRLRGSSWRVRPARPVLAGRMGARDGATVVAGLISRAHDAGGAR